MTISFRRKSQFSISPQLLQRQRRFSRSSLFLRFTLSYTLSLSPTLSLSLSLDLLRRVFYRESRTCRRSSTSSVRIRSSRPLGIEAAASVDACRECGKPNRDRCCATRPNFQNTLIINISKNICSLSHACMRACAIRVWFPFANRSKLHRFLSRSKHRRSTMRIFLCSKSRIRNASYSWRRGFL